MRDYVTLTGPEAANVAYAPTVDDEGVVRPYRPALYSVMALQSELNPRIVERIVDMSALRAAVAPAWGRLPETDAAAT
jgi:hypothetical protein